MPPLLGWQLFCEKMPWGPVFIVGGGFAMADAVEVHTIMLNALC